VIKVLLSLKLVYDFFLFVVVHESMLKAMDENSCKFSLIILSMIAIENYSEEAMAAPAVALAALARTLARILFLRPRVIPIFFVPSMS
jgi:hypothetical protein